MENSPAYLYQQRLQKAQSRAAEARLKAARFATGRVLAFLALLAAIFFFLSQNQAAWAVGAGLGGAVLFALLVKRYAAAEQKRRFFEALVGINKAELQAQAHQYRDFADSAEEALEATHPFAYDLDILGKGSLFQYLQRSGTQAGRKKLLAWLLYPCLKKEEILERQEAVAFLAPLWDWRQHFQAKAQMGEEKPDDIAEIKAWLEEKSYFLPQKTLFWAKILAPSIVLGLLLVCGLSLLPFRVFWIALIAQMAFYGVYARKIQQLHQEVGQKSQLLNQYLALLAHWQHLPATDSAKLKALQQNLTGAIQAIESLAKAVDMLNQRLNVYAGLLLNALLLWDLHWVFRIEAWKEQHRAHFATWIEALAEVDALLSLATFQANHPHFSMPEIIDDKQVFCIEAKALGHPLLKPEVCVRSDFEMRTWASFYLITGSNMAGKSTFLRAIGVNMVLAMAGAPVCAEALRLRPVALFSSMRNSDSLQDNASYFYSELRRLQQIIQALQAGAALFVILDEILRGTNSRDKQTGSKAFIEQLMQYKASGLLATHDLALTEMEQEYPPNIRNYCFEMEVEEGHISFPYKLTRGVCSSFNATLLMRQMGIIV